MSDLVLIVEGHGDVPAARILVERVLHSMGEYTITVPTPIRVKRDQFLNKPDIRERYLALAREKAGADGRILVLLDADKDCPLTIVNSHLEQMRASVAPVPLSLVLAKSEFESWFIAGAQSIGGFCNLPNDLQPPNSLEDIGAAKEWLRDRMPRGQTYSETVDQPALAARFDWQVARAISPSLDKFCREVQAQ